MTDQFFESDYLNNRNFFAKIMSGKMFAHFFHTAGFTSMEMGFSNFVLDKDQ